MALALLLLAGWAAAAAPAPTVPCAIPGRPDVQKCSWSKKSGWAYLTGAGKVIVDHVAAFDNGPAEYHDSRVRVERKERCGYADDFGKLVLPPKWDACEDFSSGVARVCKGCKPKCDGKDCEHKSMQGGTWSCVDPQGRAAACPAR